MIKALFYKEWIKLRIWGLLIFFASLLFAVILALRLRNAIELNGALLVWGAWLDRGYLFFKPFQYAPLVTGVVVAVLQFLPETQQQRIRLSLHLPLGEEKAVAIHLFAGLFITLSGSLVAYAVFASTAWRTFPVEYQSILLGTFLPWVLAGLGAYLLGAATLLETHLWNRTLLLLAGGAALRLLLREGFYDSYHPLLAGLSIWTLLLVTLPLYSSFRYRKGLSR